MTTIAQRLNTLQLRIDETCEAVGRRSDDVGILAISKTQEATAVGEAMNAGQRHFGENYLQEAIEKVSLHPQADWHFVGAIQSNKTRDIANNFNWVHSIASFKVARRLAEQRSESLKPLKILIQVNLSGEPSKSGVDRKAVASLADQISALDRISLEGLMTIPEAGLDEVTQRARFAQLRELRDAVRGECQIELPHLSMGMSNDFVSAIMEGATWIRIGTAIFGPRPVKSTTDKVGDNR
ncbi:MAG: YggS family pyridoxal phosphate-dependent enzyme [Gammaproteobacteria bacterium]|mgnify:FL=1|jgi:PLP dependent protein|nr:YggS family pyridoxal phosphate-dependent enzyme [Gammaproteobacteria bacterium]MBT4493889.1 YggS family pyridoxal phosphate-dependent enzyme [Gammaproteobacteria bacterium]